MKSLWLPAHAKKGGCISSIRIINGSQSPMRLGQADTDESILLKPGEILQYPWRSQKGRLMLRISLESVLHDAKWKWSEPFSIREGTFTSKIDYGAYINSIAISIQKKGTMKFTINLNGLISTANCLIKENLEIRFILKKNFGFIGDCGKDDVRTVLTPNNSICNSHILQLDYVNAVKIRLSGIGTPWSGDIPVTETAKKNAILVRIPHKDKGKCITVWCRIIHEELSNGFKRILFIFSPMYVARSLLPNPLRLIVNPQKEDSVESEMILDGRDSVTTLETYESADTKYHLRFIVAKNLPPSEPVLLSWGIIEQVRDKSYNVGSIDCILEELHQTNQAITKWPFMDGLTIEGHEINDQPKTDVQVTFTQLHPLCNTLCAEVNPWCLMINQIESSLILKIDNGSLYSIKPYSVLVPPSLLNTTFYIGLTGRIIQYVTPNLRLTQKYAFIKKSKKSTIFMQSF